MASNLKAARQPLDFARPTRASQAKSRRSTMGGSVQNERSEQGKLVHPRWNINTRISSPTETTDQKVKTADQKIKRFRKREEALRDRSCVSNHSSNPTRRSFSDLPAEILSQILEKLDPISRLVTRNVSRTLRSILDFQKPKISIIYLFEYSKRITCGLQQLQQEISFIQMKDVCTVRRRRKTTNVRGGDYVNLTLQLLKPILLNPKLTLSRLILRFKEGSEFIQRLFDLMSEVVKTNKSQFHVGSLDINRCKEKQPDSWLPLLKAGVLHNLEVAVDTRRGVVNCLDSEQFKGAKSIDFTSTGGLEPSLINHFLHFDSFRVLLQSIPINDILRLMENLSTSNTFKRCEIKVLVDLDLDAIEEAFEVLPADPIQQDGRLYVEVYYVQFSLCFWFRKRHFTIQRKIAKL